MQTPRTLLNSRHYLLKNCRIDIGKRDRFIIILIHAKICNGSKYHVNPLHPDISMHILYTALYTFPKVLTRRICLTIKNCSSWWSFPLFYNVNWPQKRVCKAHVISISPSSQLIEELWVVYGFYTERLSYATSGNMKTRKNKNKLIEWKAFVMGIKSALLLSKLPGYTEKVVYCCMLLRMLKSTVNNNRFKIGKYSIVQK